MKIKFEDFHNFSISLTDLKTPKDIETISNLLTAVYMKQGINKTISKEQVQKLIDNPESSLIIEDKVSESVELEIQTSNNKLEVMFDFS